MAVAPNTGSRFFDDNGNNRTGTHLSTNIIIEVNGAPVGAVKSLRINERRDIEMISEVGTDGHIDSAPRSSTQISGSCERTRFDRMRIAEAFGRGYMHAHAQRVPFDIVIKDIFAGNTNDTIVVTILKNVWIENIEYNYTADNFIIADTMGWKAETIYSFMGRGNAVVESSSRNHGKLVINPFERAADRGDRRGALDAAGLFNAYILDPTISP